MSREQIINNMQRGISPPLSPDVQQRLTQALEAFSLSQLERMNSAGVRFWPYPNSVPPEFRGIVEVDALSSPAAYLPPIRVIRFHSDSSTVSHLRHELAHAWDDVRNDPTRGLRPLDSLPETQRRAAVGRLAQQRSPFASQALRGRGRLSLQQMMERYRARLPLRELTFANPGTREGHELRGPYEFYAEGYSVFHGTCVMCQARLLRYASELYDYLEEESRTYSLATPNRAVLQSYSIR